MFAVTRIAFIGGWGHHYLRQLVKAGRAEAAVASDGFDPVASRKFAASLGEPPFYDDAATMLDAFRPDVVSVGSVFGLAGDFIALALQRDLPTVSDKPVASTWGQYDRLRDLCDGRPGRRLITEFDFRARPEFRAAARAVRAGRVGKLALITAQKSYKWGARPAWYAERATYPSTLLWVASHAIDTVRFVGGQKLLRVTARQHNVTRPEYGAAEDHAVAVYDLASGATAMVHADFLRPNGAATHGDDRLRVAGSEGVLEVRNDRCVLVTATAPETDITEEGADAHGIGEELFAAAIGESEAWFSTAESLATAEVLLKSRDAADGSTTVEL